ncbi:MAG: hypothetical protein U9R25_13140 [Chloroflexota bacterium]|nr:hypothetical protein [Chloroflexota bacterium]
MTRTRTALLWGLILLIVGTGFLLWNFGVFADYQEPALWVIVIFFALVGLAFLISFFMSRQDWWKVIPGFTLLAVAAVIFLSSRDVRAEWIGILLFLGLALAFAVIFFSNRKENWWALIPFGSMVVMIALVLLADLDLSEHMLGAILFGGMGLVFLAVYLLAYDRSQFHWTLIPAAVLFIMSLVSVTAGVAKSNPNLADPIRLWPVLLVVAGVALIVFALARRGKPVVEPVELPAEPSPSEAQSVPGTSVIEVPEDYSRPQPAPLEEEPLPMESAATASSVDLENS